MIRRAPCPGAHPRLVFRARKCHRSGPRDEYGLAVQSSHDDANSRFGLAPGSLWSLVADRTQKALRSGDLQPIETVTERLEQGGVNFIVRRVSSLQRKPPKGRPGNPFLPPDPALFIANVSETHACVLNKYNVIDHHLLFVTRYFEEQELPLTRNDFAAMLWALGEVDGLAFYNSGRVAGASQPHRHLQLVPLTLVSDAELPVSQLLGAALRRNDDRVALPFRNAVAPVLPEWLEDPTGSLAAVYDCYAGLLREVGIIDDTMLNLGEPLAPYNLLMTREWMLLVPRANEHWQGISVNALGFAGSLFVSNTDSLNAIREHGPMNVLRDVSMPVPI